MDKRLTEWTKYNIQENGGRRVKFSQEKQAAVAGHVSRPRKKGITVKHQLWPFKKGGEGDLENTAPNDMGERSSNVAALGD
jgi:hypothetical protein